MEKLTLFLDIDGVLATPSQWQLSKKSKSWIKEFDVYPFDPKCVKIFNEILDKFDLNIVIHSDWIFHYSPENLNKIFKLNNVNYNNKLDFVSFNRMRSTRISDYIKDNNIENYVVIDDISMKYVFNDRFFHVPNENEGIKQSGLKEKLINFLNKFNNN